MAKTEKSKPKAPIQGICKKEIKDLKYMAQRAAH
jgi:hypothetical protein